MSKKPKTGLVKLIPSWKNNPDFCDDIAKEASEIQDININPSDVDDIIVVLLKHGYIKMEEHSK